MQLSAAPARSSPFRSSRQLFPAHPSALSPQPAPLPLSPQAHAGFLAPPSSAFHPLSSHIPPLPSLPLFPSPCSPLSLSFHHSGPHYPVYDEHLTTPDRSAHHLRLYESDKEQQARLRAIALQVQQQVMLSSVQQATQLMLRQTGDKAKPGFTFHGPPSTFNGAPALCGGLAWPPSPVSGDTCLSRLSFSTTTTTTASSSAYSPSPASDSSAMSLPDDFDFDSDLLDIDRAELHTAGEEVGVGLIAGLAAGASEDGNGRVGRVEQREVTVGQGEWVSAVALQGVRGPGGDKVKGDEAGQDLRSDDDSRSIDSDQSADSDDEQQAKRGKKSETESPHEDDDGQDEDEEEEEDDDGSTVVKVEPSSSEDDDCSQPGSSSRSRRSSRSESRSRSRRRSPSLSSSSPSPSPSPRRPRRKANSRSAPSSRPHKKPRKSSKKRSTKAKHDSDESDAEAEADDSEEEEEEEEEDVEDAQEAKSGDDSEQPGHCHHVAAASARKAKSGKGSKRRRDADPDGGFTLPSSRRRVSHRSKLPPPTISTLRTYFLQHVDYPFPSESDKRWLVQHTGLRHKQVCDWFTNNRKRYWRLYERRMENAHCGLVHHITAPPRRGSGSKQQQRSNTRSMQQIKKGGKKEERRCRCGQDAIAIHDWKQMWD